MRLQKVLLNDLIIFSGVNWKMREILILWLVTGFLAMNLKKKLNFTLKVLVVLTAV